MSKLIYEEETFKIIGICMEVQNNLGKGFSEIVYKDALEYEFRKAQIPFEREKYYSVNYKEIILPHKFCADFIVYDKIILELKSVESIRTVHIEQVINYLAVSKNKLGMLVNFKNSKLEYKRVVFSPQLLPSGSASCAGASAPD